MKSDGSTLPGPPLTEVALISAEQPTDVYLDYVRNTENGYVSVNFAARESDSMEISCHVGS